MARSTKSVSRTRTADRGLLGKAAENEQQLREEALKGGLSNAGPPREARQSGEDLVLRSKPKAGRSTLPPGSLSSLRRIP